MPARFVRPTDTEDGHHRARFPGDGVPHHPRHLLDEAPVPPRVDEGPGAPLDPCHKHPRRCAQQLPCEVFNWSLLNHSKAV
jgi:hypothetical protein